MRLTDNKKIIILIFVMLIFYFNSKPLQGIIETPNEIDEITAIKVIGIDKENGELKITIASKVEGGVGKVGGGSEQKIIINESSGQTIFQAIREMHQFTGKLPYWGHLDYIMISENLARDGIAKDLDFFLRQYQIRMHSNVCIVKDSSVNEFIKMSAKNDTFISDNLDLLFKSIKMTSISRIKKLDDLYTNLTWKYSPQYVPCLEVFKQNAEEKDNKQSKIKENKKDDEDENKQYIVISGFGLIQEGRLIKFLNKSESMILNLMTNNFSSAINVVKDYDDNNVSLEIINTNSKVMPVIKTQNSIDVNAEITIESSIGEYFGSENITETSFIDTIQQKQEDLISKELDNLIQKNRDIDIFGVSKILYMKKTSKWNDIKEDFYLKNLKINYNFKVVSKVRRTNTINNPITLTGGLND